MVIYSIKNLINGKIYIGQTTQSVNIRWSKHRTNGKFTVTSAIKKYGKENFEFKIIAKCHSVEEMNHREIYYIKLFNSLVPNGYNRQNGIMPHSQTTETRSKISKKLKNRVITQVWKNKISASLTGKSRNQTKKRSDGGCFKGRKHSEATKEKMRMAKLKRTHNVTD